MTRPVRLQLSRRKGFDLQAISRATNGLSAVKVARPGPLGNPFVVGRDGDRERCVALFRDYVMAMSPQIRNDLLDRVRGHNVACFCSLEGPCHGDIWLELAAAPVTPRPDDPRT